MRGGPTEIDPFVVCAPLHFSCLRTQDLLLSHGAADALVRKLPPPSPSTSASASVLRELKQKDFQAVLLDVGPRTLPHFFRVCQEVGFYGEGRHFVLTRLNFGTREEKRKEERSVSGDPDNK